MRILLLGEYSGVHNNLRNALLEEGHDVVLISNGDGYKSFNSDIFISYNYIKHKNKALTKILKIYYMILAYSGFQGCIQILKNFNEIKKLKDYDVVQLINPIFLSDFGSVVNLSVFLYLKSNNKKIYLCALGDDYYWVKFCLANGFRYSIFDRLSIKTLVKFLYPLRYVYGFLYSFLNKYIAKNVDGIIPGVYDYYAAYRCFPNCTEIVPIILPINEKILKPTRVEKQLKIFHGWQLGKEIRKGNDLFDKAIKRLVFKYPNKIDYNVVGGVPYNEYVETFENCDIFIDQCYSYDRGVNALLGMRAGKVVLSGFEPEVKKYYGISYEPLINSLPQEEHIFESIEDLILNPHKIYEYSLSAQNFVNSFHSPNSVLSKYFKIWKG